MVFNSKPKELYDDRVILFNDAQLLWESSEEKINYASCDKPVSLNATCAKCNSLLPVQSGGCHVFLPTTLLDYETIEDFKKQIEAVHPLRRAVRLNASLYKLFVLLR